MKYKIVWQSWLDPSDKGEGSAFGNLLEQQTWAAWANQEFPYIRHWIEAVEEGSYNVRNERPTQYASQNAKTNLCTF